ncbi:ABC transporter substrate-binding protein [Neobacillus terrae]|uniref:ABC transporter substrate-binding protein n=1 Tax=Neobacillus terrae TaxID=3034837 RepID=UPI00140D1DE9|nr:ABC transporter substrate-binding protein [Neobacillus terrae]NHM31305.1 ABC transporter substrate-binding protein [Neobacillus terrae]
MTNSRCTKFFALLMVLLMAMFVSVGCSSEKESSGEAKKTDNTSNSDNTSGNTPQKGGTLTIGYAEEPDSLDVQKTGMMIGSIVGSNFGGSLISMHPKTKEFVPNLAESFDISDDGLTLTFKIRPNITFSDGTPLTAKNYKETFDRALDPATGATIIPGQFKQVKEILAPDDSTLIIKLNEPSAPFLVNLSDPGYMQPLSLAAIKKEGDNYGRNPVGVGPFKFKEWKTGQSITLERNNDFKWPAPFFKNQGSAYPDQLVYKFIKDYQTMIAALDSGSIDVAYGIAGKDVDRYENNNKYQVFEMDRQGIGLFLEMNTENEALKDKIVRQAVNTAINKEAIVQAVLNGKGRVAHGPIPASFFGYDPDVEKYDYKYNIDKAIKLLESDGWSKNDKGIMEKDGKELSFNLMILDRWNQPSQMVQAMLKDIGISIKIQALEAGALIEKAASGDFDMTFMGYFGVDPDSLYTFLHSSQINVMNHSRVNNPELDSLLDKGRKTIDLEERKKVYFEAQKLIVDEAYWVPIYSEKQYHVANKRVHGITQAFNGLLFQDSWVSK